MLFWHSVSIAQHLFTIPLCIRQRVLLPLLWQTFGAIGYQHAIMADSLEIFKFQNVIIYMYQVSLQTDEILTLYNFSH